MKEVRGRGWWIGIELHKQARLYCEALKEQGILCKETHERVIRIAPPLVITGPLFGSSCGAAFSTPSLRAHAKKLPRATRP